MGNQLIKKSCKITFEHPQFKEDFIQLTRNELNPFQIKKYLTNTQIGKLLEAASLFALDVDKKYQKLAFKIAVYLLNQYKEEYPYLPLAVEIILSRLGNIPTIRSMIENKHGEDYFSYFQNDYEEPNYITINTYLKFPEILVKQITNKKRVTKDVSLTFTDFQASIYSLLREKRNVTISAPTSTGKSYIMHNYIAERMLRSEKFCAVYIVPTKALIAEVQASLERTIIGLGIKSDEFAVFISANYMNINEIKKISRKVFVLTQERLQEAMANNPLMNVDLLVVDEAQKVSDEGRGVIIEDSVQELIEKNPTVQKVVICPYAENPETFKIVFGISEDIEPKKTSDSPVTQNIYFINFEKKAVSISLDSWDLELDEQEKVFQEIKVDKIKLLPKSRTKRKAWVVTNLVPKGEPTIIYCDRPYDCRLVAENIAKKVSSLELTEAIKNAITFFTTFVHEDYYLVDAIKNRIGYHYGKMPQFVRFYIKELFENKEIDLLCCTSTLLEGVNMPAKNIVLYSPKAGDEMDRLSILNLAGRAGRLLKDYYGKIYCINVNEWKNGEDVFSEKLEEIETSVERTLKKNINDLISYLEDENYLPSEGKLKESVKTLATSLLMKQLRYPDLHFLANLKKRCETISQQQLNMIKELLVKKTAELILDKEIILKNRSIDPRFQNELYKEIKSDFEPLPFPDDYRFYYKLCSIFQKLSKHIFREYNRSYEYFAFLASRWIQEAPYKSLIEGKISYNVRQGRHLGRDWKKFVNRLIDELDDEIEQKLKYEYTRALKCYLDITEAIQQKIGDSRPYCRALPIFLEAGTKNRNTLFLLEVGLSRTVAIRVAHLMDFVRLEDSEQCIKWLKLNRTKIKNSLPQLLFSEVKDLFEKYDLDEL